MSKRRGDVVFLDELIDEIGVDAARWYLVNRGPDQTIEIDVDLARGEDPEEPRLLRPVRARAHRRDPAQRRRARSADAEPPAELAARGARARQAPRRVPRDRGGGGRAPRARRRSRTTRSGSPTTSTASTTTTGCSAREAEAFRLGLCEATQRGDRVAASTSSGSRRPTGCKCAGTCTSPPSRPPGG